MILIYYEKNLIFHIHDIILEMQNTIHYNMFFVPVLSCVSGISPSLEVHMKNFLYF